jgi:uncharacterized protein YegJ (DUF2314 family)
MRRGYALLFGCAVSLAVAACRDDPPPVVRASAASAASSAAARRDRPPSDDLVVDVRADDPELVAARARARREIDAVILRNAEAPLEELSVKAPITDGIHVEHVWLADVRYADGVFTGTIDNDPQRVKMRRAGDVVSVKKEEISDYMYEKDGKIRGNYTLRALIDRLPPEEAEQYRGMLGPEG